MCGIVAYIGPREAYPVILKGLKRLGFEAAKNDSSLDEVPPLPDDEMDFVSQLTRARLLHQRLAAQGESLEILGQLVRAYANLGNFIIPVALFYYSFFPIMRKILVWISGSHSTDSTINQLLIKNYHHICINKQLA